VVDCERQVITEVGIEGTKDGEEEVDGGEAWIAFTETS